MIDQAFELFAILSNRRFQRGGTKLSVDFGLPETGDSNIYETDSMDTHTIGEVQHRIFQLRCFDISPPPPHHEAMGGLLRPREEKHFRGIWKGEDTENGRLQGFRFKFLWVEPDGCTSDSETLSEPDEQPPSPPASTN